MFCSHPKDMFNLCLVALPLTTEQTPAWRWSRLRLMNFCGSIHLGLSLWKCCGRLILRILASEPKVQEGRKRLEIRVFFESWNMKPLSNTPKRKDNLFQVLGPRLNHLKSQLASKFGWLHSLFQQLRSEFLSETSLFPAIWGKRN